MAVKVTTSCINTALFFPKMHTDKQCLDPKGMFTGVGSAVGFPQHKIRMQKSTPIGADFPVD